MTSHFLAAAAAFGLLGAGIANAGETRSIDAMTGQTTMFAATESSGSAARGSAAGSENSDEGGDGGPNNTTLLAVGFFAVMLGAIAAFGDSNGSDSPA